MLETKISQFMLTESWTRAQEIQFLQLISCVALSKLLSLSGLQFICVYKIVLFFKIPKTFFISNPLHSSDIDSQ